MKKLRLHLLFLILLPLQSQASEPSAEIKSHFEQLNREFYKIRSQNNPSSSEYKVSPNDISTILSIIANIKTEDINKPDAYNKTFLKICIEQTSDFPEADAEKIIKKLLEKGADITYNSYIYPDIAQEAPLWSAALSGNVGAYNAMVNHIQENHLVGQYEEDSLNLIIDIGLKHLKIMESYYKSELQKVKNGKRKEYTYQYFNNKPGSEIRVAYEEYVAVGNLEFVVRLKNQFQKMQNINAQHYPENKKNTSSEQESHINTFLEKRILVFDVYKRSKIYKYVNGTKESLK